jgi:hypothetical protein
VARGRDAIDFYGSGVRSERMLDRLLRRPRIEATLAGAHVATKEFARELAVSGTLTVRNTGAATTLSDWQLMVIGGGTRRIPLETPAELARSITLESATERTVVLAWNVKLDGARGRQWVFVVRLPFSAA